ncbi:hypothetical protein BD309DRAFT_821296, partial [Dichomitus squalens]
MWLKAYLDFSEDRPKWAYIADDILATNVPKNCRPEERALRVNTFLQRWQPKQKSAGKIPSELKAILTVAKKHNLVLNALAPARAIQRQLPMWDHAKADRQKLRKLSANDARTVHCLKSKHKLLLVGDFEHLSNQMDSAEHISLNDECECRVCMEIENGVGCLHPRSCMTRARAMLDTLQTRWDPRGELPEDYEENLPDDDPIEDGEVVFDRSITTHGTVSDVLRIFADNGETCGERLDMRLLESGRTMTVAIDGTYHKSQADQTASIGAGVYVSDNNPLNRSMRLPETMAQTAQTGKLVASLEATS